jgi:Tetrahydrofolate dehydrogenase/cyclohydrolase, NAD(P)-binding domain
MEADVSAPVSACVAHARRLKTKLNGHVASWEAIARAEEITPVPGGAGPMTIAMLMRTTLLAAPIEIAALAQARPLELWEACEFAARHPPVSGCKSRSMARRVPLRGDLSLGVDCDRSPIDTAPPLDKRMKVDDIS